MQACFLQACSTSKPTEDVANEKQKKNAGRKVRQDADTQTKRTNKNVLNIFGFLRHIIRIPHIDRQVNINAWSTLCATSTDCVCRRTCPISLFKMLTVHLLFIDGAVCAKHFKYYIIINRTMLNSSPNKCYV